MDISKIALLLLGLTLQAVHVLGHGYLLQPPARGTAWRVGFNTPTDWTDNEENCGGFSNQWDVNGGKCGICGDPWQGPKENETPGIYASGTIVATYTEGQEFDVQVRITSNHKGWFEFRLCENNNFDQDKDQTCFDDHLLEYVGGGTRKEIGDGAKIFSYRLKLPQAVTCDQCILQWHYNAGNSWGTCPNTGESCIGCGPQETFRGCSDIRIISGGGANPTTSEGTPTPEVTVPEVTTTEGTKTDAPTEATTANQGTTAPSGNPTTEQPAGNCHAVPPYANQPGMDQWCVDNCALNYCPETHCSCLEPSQNPETTTETAPQEGGCHAVAPYAGQPGMVQWCVDNCALNYCPETHCSSSCLEPSQNPETTTEAASQEGGCHAVPPYAGQPGMDQWCVDNCALNYCPETHCSSSCLQPSQNPETTTESAPQEGGCHAVPPYAGQPGMDQWCVDNCGLNYCPETHCSSSCQELCSSSCS